MINKNQIHQLLFIEKHSLQEAGELLGVTRQRISQLVKQYFPSASRKDFGKGARRAEQKRQLQEERLTRYGRETFQHITEISEAFSRAFSRKKQNAKASGWEWELLPSDLDIPTHCPILGLELDWFAEVRQENSPSFDRLNTNIGYVRGNVQVISWRANRIKNNGTAEEHRKIADFLENLAKSS